MKLQIFSDYHRRSRAIILYGLVLLGCVVKGQAILEKTTQPAESPVPTNTNWIVLFREGFEKGFDLFLKGGKNCNIDKKNRYKGSASLRLRHNTGTSKAITKDAYNVSSMNQVKVNFFYKTKNVKKGERFFLEYLADGGSWKRAKTFVRGWNRDWKYNKKWVEASVELDVSSTSTIQLRFRSKFKRWNEVVYIDNVIFGGMVPDSSKPSSGPTKRPTFGPTSIPTPRFTALGDVIGSYYNSGSPFGFGSTTNQYKALERLVDTDPTVVPVPVPNDSNSEYLLLQRYVLVLLYLNTNTDHIQDGVVTCGWSRVTCNGGGSITELQLYNINYSGSLSTELGFMTTLQQLNLPYNQLTGTIPTEVGNLSALQRLDLYYNQLTGTIPSELGNLSSLQYLQLRSNKLTGTVPSLPDSISECWLTAAGTFGGTNTNNFDGTLPSPCI